MTAYKQTQGFSDFFITENECFLFLMDTKWGKGFRCRKCNHEKYCSGKKWHHKRCTRCGYDESATARTLFHKIKFPLLKAFQITHRLTINYESASSHRLSRDYGITQETSWFFKRKVQHAMSKFENRSFRTTPGGKLLSHLSKPLLKTPTVGLSLEAHVKLTTYKYHTFPFSSQVTFFHLVPPFSSEAERIQILRNNARAQDNWKNRIHLGMKTSEDVLHYRFDLVDWIQSTHKIISSKHLYYYCVEFNYRKMNKVFGSFAFLNCLKAMFHLPWLPYRTFLRPKPFNAVTLAA